MAEKIALVIGAGSAGCSAAVELARSGWRVAIAEPGGVGGTCLWAGCVPKKALYVSANAYRELGRDRTFGVEPNGGSFAWREIMAWKRHAQSMVAGDQEALLARHGIEHVRGSARFVSPTQARVGERVFCADAFVIATGARTILPPIPGVELADTSGAALSYRDVPASLVIVGAGYIGLEFAAAFSALGTKVTLIAHGDRVLPMFDAEVAGVSAALLAEEGVDIRTNTTTLAFGGARGAVVARVRDASGAESELRSERLLVAVGRRPDLGALDLAAADVAVDERGRLVLDETQRSTSNPRVWAAGDAAGTVQLKPAAEMAGALVGRSVGSGAAMPIAYDTVPSTVFTLPQIAQVGITEAQAADRGIAHRVCRQRFDTLGSAIIDDVRTGLIKLVFAERDGRLLGAAIASPHASELVYACALGMRTGATFEDVRETVGVHAAYSEGMQYAALGQL